MTMASDINPILCPCCCRPVVTPSFEALVEALNLRNQEAYILEAIWYGPRWDASAHPNRKPWRTVVEPETIWGSMYRDDEDGGPSETRMKNALKWAFHNLKHNLAGSGVGVSKVGYRSGYRLVIHAGQEKAA